MIVKFVKVIYFLSLIKIWYKEIILKYLNSPILIIQLKIMLIIIIFCFLLHFKAVINNILLLLFIIFITRLQIKYCNSTDCENIIII